MASVAKAGVEAAAGALFLGPGEKGRGRDIVLAGAGRFRSGDEGALRGQLRLFEIAGRRHRHIADIAVAVAVGPDAARSSAGRAAATPCR